MTDSESSSAIPHRQYSGEEAARGSVITVFGDAFRQTGQVDDEADFDLDDEHTSDGGHVARELFQAWGAEEQLHTAHAKLNEKKKQRVKKSSSAMLERLALHQRLQARIEKTHGFAAGVGFAVLSFVNVLNVIAIGVETDVGCMTCDGPPAMVWLLLDVAFCGLFIAELVTKLWEQGVMLFFTGERWYSQSRRLRICFLKSIDVTLIFLRFLGLMMSAAGRQTPLKAVTLLRILNLGSLLSYLRMSKVFRELVLMLHAITDVLKTLSWVVIILFLVMVTFGIILTVGIGQDESLAAVVDYSRSEWTLKDYWGTVGATIMSLFEIITFSRWSESLVRPLVRQKSYLVIPFLIFIIVTSMCCLVQITAILVEAVIAHAKSNTDLMKAEDVRKNTLVTESVRYNFLEGDVDGNGMIDQEELAIMLRNPEVRDRLEFLDIDLADLLMLHELLDADGTGLVPIDKFFRGTARLPGPAMAIDMQTLSVDLGRRASQAQRLNDVASLNMDILHNITERMNFLEREVLLGEDDSKDPVIMRRRLRGPDGARVLLGPTLDTATTTSKQEISASPDSDGGGGPKKFLQHNVRQLFNHDEPEHGFSPLSLRRQALIEGPGGTSTPGSSRQEPVKPFAAPQKGSLKGRRRSVTFQWGTH
eukprot:TRINITY_DN18419_c0_g1_i6.p1 TRINITY_DN18419_c0_g1~~TRINITY_DN18419_c0_g1_i6.p1  ORF type:complete len:647 (-),score=128.18 TRINITY_DN18419_c0_g1_i6:50-1990(-)